MPVIQKKKIIKSNKKNKSNKFVYDDYVKEADKKAGIVRDQNGFVTTKIKKNIHEFWEKQPVRQIIDVVTNEGEINSTHEINNSQTELDEMYMWDTLDLNNDNQILELESFLGDCYVEDVSSEFRLFYKKTFLKRMLTGPTKTFSICIRNKDTMKLEGYISGVEVTMSLNSIEKKTADINFLCLSKELRKKGYAQKLIMEVSRIANINDIWQGIFTAEKKLPTPFTLMKYYHRPINYRKLVDVKFCYDVDENIINQKHIYFTKQMKLDNKFKLMEERHHQQAHDVLTSYLNSFSVHQCYSYEEFVHYFANNDNNVVSYVMEDDDGNVEDFVSYYRLDSKLLNHKTYQDVKEGYLYMYSSNKYPVDYLINCIVTMAQQNELDVFNALTQMETKSEMLLENKFIEGSGALKMYVYNWKLKDVIPYFVSKAVV